MSKKDKSRSNKKLSSSDGKALTNKPERLSRKRTRIPENENSKNVNERENISGPSGAKKQKTLHQTEEDLSSSSDTSTPSGSQNLFDSRQQSQGRESETETAGSSKSSSFEKYLQVILLQ